MTLNELTQGFIHDLTIPGADQAKVKAVWEKRFEEAGYGPLEWTVFGWSMNKRQSNPYGDSQCKLE